MLATTGHGIASPTDIDQTTTVNAPTTPTDALSDASSSFDGSNSEGFNTIINWIIAALAVLSVSIFFILGLNQLKNAPKRPIAFSAELGVGLFAAMLVLGFIGVIVANSLHEAIFLSGDENTNPLRQQTFLAIGAYAGQALVALCYGSLVRRAARDHPAPPSRFKAALIAVAALLMLWPILAITSTLSAWVWQRATDTPVELLAHETLKLLAESAGGGWHTVFVILVVLAAPILEEVLYRGIGQQTLRRFGLGRWSAITITSLIFVSMHLGAVAWYMLPTLFVLSLAFGWLYEKSGRLTAPVIAHILFNLANLTITFILF